MSADVLRVAIVAVVGYLVGGIPFGVIFSRYLYHVDITKTGSGNTGATNVMRTLGWRAALPVALLDIAKGVAPAVLARLIADPGWELMGSDLLVVLAGVAAMLGHMYSPYFRLRGGKGIATAAGGIIVLMPLAFPVLLVIFAAIIALTRIVSVGSLLSALVFPLVILLVYPQRPVLLVFALAAVPLVFWAHRSNIGRLMRGEEPRTTIGSARSRDTGEGRDGQ